MAFKIPGYSAKSLYAKFGVLQFSDMVHLQNIVLLHKLYCNEMPPAVHSTFAVDFTNAHPTRAQTSGLLHLPTVQTTCFGTNSIRHNAIRSWNSIHSLLPIKLVDLESVKNVILKNSL